MKFGKVGEVHFCRSGSTGNIFCVLGGAAKILRKCHLYDEMNEMANRVYESGSYEKALEIIGEYVNLVEEEFDFSMTEPWG